MFDRRTNKPGCESARIALQSRAAALSRCLKPLLKPTRNYWAITALLQRILPWLQGCEWRKLAGPRKAPNAECIFSPYHAILCFCLVTSVIWRTLEAQLLTDLCQHVLETVAEKSDCHTLHEHFLRFAHKTIENVCSASPQSNSSDGGAESSAAVPAHEPSRSRTMQFYTAASQPPKHASAPTSFWQILEPNHHPPRPRYAKIIGLYWLHGFYFLRLQFLHSKDGQGRQPQQIRVIDFYCNPW